MHMFLFYQYLLVPLWFLGVGRFIPFVVHKKDVGFGQLFSYTDEILPGLNRNE